MDAQHDFQRIGLAAISWLGIIASNTVFQALLGDQLAHLLEKLLAPGFLLFVVVLGFGKADLIHGRVLSGNFGYYAKIGDLFRGSLA